MATYCIREDAPENIAALVATPIEATRWEKNGDHPLDFDLDTQGMEGGKLRTFTGAERKAKGWEGGVVRYYRHPSVPGTTPCPYCGKTMHVHGWLDFGGSGIQVCPGSYVVTVPFDSGRANRPRYTAIDEDQFDRLYRLLGPADSDGEPRRKS